MGRIHWKPKEGSELIPLDRNSFFNFFFQEKIQDVYLIKAYQLRGANSFYQKKEKKKKQHQLIKCSFVDFVERVLRRISLV